MELRIDDITPLRRSGAGNTLYLVPGEEAEDEVPYVYLYSDIGGNSWPMGAHHKRQLSLGAVPGTAVGSAVEAIVREHEQTLLKLAAAYRGTEWDGNNRHGTWALSIEERQAMIASLRQDLANVQTYWEAADYFAPTTLRDVVSDYDEEVELDAIVDAEVAKGGDEFILDPDDVRSQLQWMAEDWRERHGETDQTSQRVAHWAR